MSFAVSAGAVRPPPSRLMPLLFESAPPTSTRVVISLPSTTSTPAASMRFSTSCVLLAGPSVATILVARCIRSPSASLRPVALLQDRHRGQFLAFEEFEEGAAGGRDVADAIRDAELVDRGDRVAASGDGKGGRLGDRPREFPGPGGKGVEL